MFKEDHVDVDRAWITSCEKCQRATERWAETSNRTKMWIDDRVRGVVREGDDEQTR